MESDDDFQCREHCFKRYKSKKNMRRHVKCAHPLCYHRQSSAPVEEKSASTTAAQHLSGPTAAGADNDIDARDSEAWFEYHRVKEELMDVPVIRRHQKNPSIVASFNGAQ